MNFQIKALPASEFTHLFQLTDEQLSEQNATRVTVTLNPGTPCRVSMQDAEAGETVILLNYTHLPVESPFASRHAVYVREGVEDAKIEINAVPEVIQSRVISLRLFDENDMMIDADLAEGTDIAGFLEETFDDPEVAYVHLHYAKPGCFAASAHRA